MKAKRLRKAIIGILIVCVLVLAGKAIFSFGDDSVPKERIFRYVERNVETLEAFPYGDYKKVKYTDEERPFLREALGRGTIVKDVYRYNARVLQFYCGGTGIVTSSTYCGFYRSATDEPFAFEFGDVPFTETPEGVYEWVSADGERAVYTERILPGWFWYHQIWN